MTGTHPSDPKTVIERVARCRKSLQEVFGSVKNPVLVDRWPEFERRLLAIGRESGKRPEVEISLVGGTGAGKSTLLNALIGARVLPVSNMRACTAAITEVAYADDISYRRRSSSSLVNLGSRKSASFLPISTMTNLGTISNL